MRKGERVREGGRDFKSFEIIAPQTLKRCAEAWSFLAIHPVASDKMDNRLFSWLLLLSLPGKTSFSANPQFMWLFSYISTPGSGGSFTTKLSCCSLENGNNFSFYATNLLYRFHSLDLLHPIEIMYLRACFPIDYEFLGRCPCFTYLCIAVSQHGIINICWINE